MTIDDQSLPTDIALVDDYINHMSRNTSKAGHPEIFAAAMALARPIHVYQN